MSSLPTTHPDVDVAPLPGRLVLGSEADVDRYIEKLEAFERGEMTPTQWKQECRLNGVYDQRQDGLAMIRVKIPGGIMTPRMIEAFATASERWGHDRNHVTTRQNIQYHFIPMDQVETLLRYLADAGGLTTREACGNSVRNFTACPRAGVSHEEPFDVSPYVEVLAGHFLRQDFAYGLPRKFKPSIGGCCGTDCSAAFINDLGLLARVQDGVKGFKVLAGGGTATLRRSALVVEEFVPATEMLEAAEAVVRVFNRIGNRNNIAKARLKWAIDKIGPAAFIGEYHAEREKLRLAGGRPFTLPPQPAPPTLKSPLPQVAQPLPGYEEWAADSVRPQKQAGFSVVEVRLVLGDMTAAQLRGLGRIAAEHGENELRLTNEQNALLRYIPTWKVPLVHAQLAELGLAKAGVKTVLDVTSCPGASSCAMAVTQSRGLARLLTDELEARPTVTAKAKDLSIKISGCPNGCGQHHVSGLGFQGGMRKIDGKAVPQYLLHIGGGVGPDGATFGRLAGKVPLRKVPDAVEALIGLYDAEKRDGEAADAFFARVAVDRVKATIAPWSELAADDAGDADFLDLDEHRQGVELTGPKGSPEDHMC
jgi:sulfite reductase (NADPH) hemoprotein beta-component